MAEIPVSAADGNLSHGSPTCGPLRADQLPQALCLSQALNWPYRLEDWQDALRLGHGAGVEIEGELKATALWWPWGEHVSTCGMIIVDTALQGRGIGRALVTGLLDAAGPRTMLLRSTAAGERLYEQLGFVAFGRVHQHQATLAAACPDPAGAGTRTMQADDAAALLELDRVASGMDRSRLLAALFAAGRFIVTGPPGRPGGYACVRRWGRGVVVGPVVAADPDIARGLIASALWRHPGEFARIDVTADSGLSPWLEGLGLPCVDRVTSMARGTPPGRTARAALFALASQFLG